VSALADPPLYDTVDVAVVGGGPAGLAAAAAAARGGARTLLIERYGFLGGMGTAGGVTNFAGLYGRVDGQWTLLVRGIAEELLARIDALGGLNAPQDGLQGRIRVRSYDTSAYKCAADGLMEDAGVELLFHALVTGVEAADDGALSSLVVQTRSGPRAIKARVFIDASGDGDVCALAGAPFELGDGEGSGLYPTTMFRITGVDAPRALAAVGDFKAIDALMAAAAGRYRFPRRGAILRPQLDPTEWRANVTQLAAPDGRALDALDARELSRGELEGRRQIVEYMRFLRAEVPGFEKARIAEIAPQVGVRETRRVLGAYVLSGEDIAGSARFEDSIGLNAWPMELHVAGRIEWGFPRDAERAFNELPYRMLLPRGVGNLLVAGRCASMSHEGQSAARASGACFVMGQAAGTAAALALRAGHARAAAVDISALQGALRAAGARLDAVA
jgi:hypothetical protein